MPTRTAWTRDQLLVAFMLYCQIPFGKMHSGNPVIIKAAQRIDRTPSALAMKLTNIASLDPAIRSTGRRGLGGASAADRSMWEEMEQHWEEFALEAQEVFNALDEAGKIDPEQFSGELESYVGRTRTTQINARVGQQFFRRAVLSAYNYRCCITGLSATPLLVASHIVPWKVDLDNRLNPRNGLCLSSLHDRAFDIGVLTITADLKVKISKYHSADRNQFFQDALVSFDGKAIDVPEKFSPDLKFLTYHHENIFQQ